MLKFHTLGGPRWSPRVALHLLPPVLLLLTVDPAGAISSRTLIAATGSNPSSELGTSVEPAGDVNGDGFADVLVGAPGYNASTGRAYVYFGGLVADDVPDLTLTGEQAGDRFGQSVAGVGDVNGDGYPDLLVGAWSNDAAGPDGGRAYLYHGGPAADAVPDLVLTGATSSNYFGFSVSAAGDFNDDSFADIAIGAYGHNSSTGRVYIYHGGPGMDATPDLSLSGEATDHRFGWSVALAGDMGGDGHPDLVVGAPGYSYTCSTNGGRAYLYFGGPFADSNADRLFSCETYNQFFGAAVAGAGDVNNDGFADLVVGGYGYPNGANQGSVRLFFGGPNADNYPDLSINGVNSGDYLGNAVAAADVNGDGYSDLLIGSRGAGGNVGRAYLYFGGVAPDANPDFTLVGLFAGEYLGSSVAAAGDVDGDGNDDVVVGAYQGGVSQAGRAVVTSIYAYQILTPNGGESWITGRVVTVRYRGRDLADLALSVDDGRTFTTLATSVGGRDENAVNLVVPFTTSPFARLRIHYSGQTPSSTNSDLSRRTFRIVQPFAPLAAAQRLLLEPTGAAGGDRFGFAVAGAGDMNADGFDDVVIGGPLNDAAGLDAGAAYVLFGGPTADSQPDLVLGGAAAGDFHGYSVAAAGDVNGDGDSDVVVGAPLNDQNGLDAGRALVYFGGPAADGIPDLVLRGGPGEELGFSVSAAGDVNGDGYADVLAGAPRADEGGTDTGKAYVFFGSPVPDAVPDLVLRGLSPGDQLGAAVAAGGDMNGDGHGDLVVGAPLNDRGGTDAGAALVFFGSATPDAVADVVFLGEDAGDHLGYAVAGGGDLNGDGYPDVLCGAPWHDGAAGLDSGRALVFTGAPFIDAVPDLVIPGIAADDKLGFSVTMAGDLNRDGIDDFCIGSPTSDAGRPNGGRAQAYFGALVLDAIADLAIAGREIDDQLGYAVGRAGDTTGDGFPDIIAGAPFSDAGGQDGGAAYVHDVSRYFLLSPAAGETWNVGATRIVSWTGAEPADVWLSADGGASFEKLRSRVGGRETNSIHLLVPHLPTRFAKVALLPADPDVLGRAESDSLFTIIASVSLLRLAAQPAAEGGVLLSWSTEPRVGDDGIAGYRLYRSRPAAGAVRTRLGPDLIRDDNYRDPDGQPADRYSLAAVNGLGAEIALGETALATVATALRVWPLPMLGGEELHIDVGLAASGNPLPTDLDAAIFNTQGRRVITLTRDTVKNGNESAALVWNGRDSQQREVAGGIYFLRVSAPSIGLSDERKILVIR